MKTKFLLIIFVLLLINSQVFSQNKDGVKRVSNAANDAKLPFFTKDHKGNPVLCWSEQDSSEKTFFYYSTFDNRKNTFSAPVSIPVPSNIRVHNESMPKVAFKRDGSVWAFYQTQEPGGHFSSNLRFLISKNGGKSWSGSRFISNDSTSGKSRSFFDITTLSDGEIGLVWLDQKLSENASGRPVFFAKTKGIVIDEPVIVDANACECCRTDIINDEKGNIHIVYRDLYEGSIRDMSYVTSVNSGKTFSKAIKISNDNWKVEGCPHSGPAICASSSKVGAAWYTGKEGIRGVYYSSASFGAGFSPRALVTTNENAAHPQICSTKNKSLVVWDELVERDDVRFRQVKYRFFEEEPSQLESLSPDDVNASFPVALALDNGQVLVAWQQAEGDKSQMVVKKIAIN